MDDNFLKEFGYRAMARRQELGMSQLEVAHKIGFKTKQAYSMIECGNRGLSQSKCVALAKALDTTVAYLMGVDENDVPFGYDIEAANQEMPREQKESEIDRLFNLLAPESQDIILKLVRDMARKDTAFREDSE